MIKTLIYLSAIFYLALSCSINKLNTNYQARGLTTDQWLEDLNVLARTLPQKHKNAFHTTSREQFENSVASLRTALPSMTDEEIEVRFREIVSMVGDGHTQLSTPGGKPTLPLRFAWFGDPVLDPQQMELRVTNYYVPVDDSASIPEYSKALGTRVVKVGEKTTSELYKELIRIIPQGETQGSSRLVSASYLRRPDLLKGLGIIPQTDSVQLTFEDKKGQQFTEWISPLPAEKKLKSRSFSTYKPIYQARLNQPFWFSRLTDAKGDSSIVYVAFNEYPGSGEFNRRINDLFNYIDQHNTSRLVIDLRYNSGGDYTKVRRLLIPRLKKHPLSAPGNLYILTGPTTFSAAMTNALDFRKELGAVLVGEPTGARPNQYQEKGKGFTLPNSGFQVSYSIRYYKFQDEDTHGVLPDVYARQNWEDYTAGKDPALTFVQNVEKEEAAKISKRK